MFTCLFGDEVLPSKFDIVPSIFYPLNTLPDLSNFLKCSVRLTLNSADEKLCQQKRADTCTHNVATMSTVSKPYRRQGTASDQCPHQHIISHTCCNDHHTSHRLRTS